MGYVIQNTSYISRIAGTGDVAIALDEGYVEKLKASLIEDENNVGDDTAMDYQLGDFVKVVDGPFRDMQGKVSGVDTKALKVEVLLTMFDRDTVVSLDVLQIKKMI